ncbi:capsular exopolysaccharide family [Bradyrhizobium lablabi]|uniref:non-specific protein-tyrosine kinase n=1 Tax=Bradyrhizobium lablabi TaxID=722472 RepID=A0A1M6HHM3_9BRAD|nr:capsular exopolysaccharide family [Bradyrhizobium lablabi]
MAGAEEPLIDLGEAFRVLRRRRVLVASILALAVSGAAVYLAMTPGRYTASSMLLFDVRKNEPFQQQGYPNAAADSAFVDSEVEVLKSENLARSVVRTLSLQSDPEFAPSAGFAAAIQGFIEGIVEAVLGTSRTSTESDQFGRVVRLFQKNLTIKRTGLTYVVSIDYRSLDPNRAARISNAAAEAYLVGELESKYQAARRANIWLQDRINELKAQAEKTERAVAEYKAKNNVDTSGPRPNEQQLVDASSERRIILKDLESSAQTNRALHEALLQRVTEFTQQQSFPATEARVVSPASPPLEKSEPKALIALGVASILGLVGGFGAAFAREYLDRTFRSSKQVEREVGVECLGILPAIAPARWRLPKWHRDVASGERIISERHRFVVGEPLSRFAETIRDLKVAADTADLHRSDKVIGITSARPHEGKSLLAANLSEMIALSGCKVLLIDCELRNGGLTGQFAPKAKGGLLEVVAGRAAVNDFIWCDPITNLHFLPAVKLAGGRDQNTKEQLSPAALFQRTQLTPMGLKALLESVQDSYDYVILDLPPITPVADVKAISHLIDAFILVIEFGRTSQQAVIDALNAAPTVCEKLLGAVLNKADPDELRRLAS